MITKLNCVFLYYVNKIIQPKLAWPSDKYTLLLWTVCGSIIIVAIVVIVAKISP